MAGQSDSEVIEELGGPTAVGALCEIRPQAVSQWKRHGIPKPWRKYLLLLRPAAFSSEDATAEQPSPAAQ